MGWQSIICWFSFEQKEMFSFGQRTFALANEEQLHMFAVVLSLFVCMPTIPVSPFVWLGIFSSEFLWQTEPKVSFSLEKGNLWLCCYISGNNPLPEFQMKEVLHSIGNLCKKP